MGLTHVQRPIEIIWAVTVRKPLKRQRERKKSGLSQRPWVRFTAAPLFFLSFCRFKSLRTVTAQIISIGLQTWVSPIYRAPYAVMKLRFFRNHVAVVFIHSYTPLLLSVSAVMQETGGDGVGCLFEATGVPPAVNGCFELIR